MDECYKENDMNGSVNDMNMYSKNSKIYNRGCYNNNLYEN